MYKNYQAIQWEIDGHTGVLRLNRPERLNAIDNVMRNDMEHLLRAAEADPEVWTLVVTGNGRGFCSGADLKARAEAEKTGSGGTAPQPLIATRTVPWGALVVMLRLHPRGRARAGGVLGRSRRPRR